MFAVKLSFLLLSVFRYFTLEAHLSISLSICTSSQFGAFLELYLESASKTAHAFALHSMCI